MFTLRSGSSKNSKCIRYSVCELFDDLGGTLPPGRRVELLAPAELVPGAIIIDAERRKVLQPASQPFATLSGPILAVFNMSYLIQFNVSVGLEMSEKDPGFCVQLRCAFPV